MPLGKSPPNKRKNLRKELIGKIFNLKNFDEPMMVSGVKFRYVRKWKRIVYVKFRYSNKYETIEAWYNYDDVKRGHVKNYLKLGRFDQYRGKPNRNIISNHYLHSIWSHIHERCNSNKVYEKVTVCKEWLNYNKFLEWVWSNKSNYKPDEFQQIDKDILQWNSDTKIYDPDTCIFIPTYLNKYLSGISKRVHVDKITSLRLNDNYLSISASDVNNNYRLFYYARYHLFKRLIEYYYDDGKIPTKLFKILNLINIDTHLVYTADKLERQFPKETMLKIDEFINNELYKLKLRENKMSSEY
jgi:hypothetical protein